jgi:hypothetical protein
LEGKKHGSGMKERRPFHKQIDAKPKKHKLREILPTNKIFASFRPRYTQRTVQYNKIFQKINNQRFPNRRPLAME